MAQWQQIDGGTWVQWADLRLADAWFRRAQELANMEIVGGGIAAQQERARGAWEALSNAFRAIDTPPPNSPQFRGAIARAYGTHGYESDVSVPGNYWTDGSNPESTDGYSAIAEESRRLYFGQRPVPFGGSTPIVVTKIRYMLDQRGLVVDACSSPSGECYSPPPYWMSSPSDPRAIFSGEADWENWGFWDGGPFAWLAAENVGKVLPPLKWSVAIVKEIADQCVALGALEILTQARLNAVLLNFAMARRYNLLDNAELLAASAALPAQMLAAATTDQTQSSKVAAQGMMLLGSTLMAAGAYQGTTVVGGLTGSATFAIGAIIGAAGLAVSFAPSAVGPAASDMFGRAEPLYERPNISGGGGSAMSSVRLNVPDPPGYVPARFSPILTSVFLPDLHLCTPPSDFFSAELRRVWISQHPGCPDPPPYVDHSISPWGPLAVGAVLLGSLWKILNG